jgi:2-polyprenyl-3-methyl-5-hydroxy-6-metoxy-1,4-benzoquinol methylase
VVCCEVLEHLDHPEKGMAELYRILKKDGVALVSVPHEPIWRVLNLARFKYVSDMGNTPGHLNHWTRSQFKDFAQKIGFTVVKDNSPFPWTMLLLQKS